MIHFQLSANPDTHYGTGINSSSNYILLQLGEKMDQIRVRLTIEEVDRLISHLEKRKEELLNAGFSNNEEC
jgi:hypothetical protein